MGFSGTIGHEFVGRVERVAGEGGQEWVGRRVCGDINLACADAKACTVCAEGTTRSRNHCPTRSVLGILNKDGTWASYLTLPIRNLHQIPDGVSDEVATFVEPLAAAYRIVEQGLIGKGDRVAILGDGKLG